MSLTTYKRAAHYRDQNGLSHRAASALTAETLLSYYVNDPDTVVALRELGFTSRQGRRLRKRARRVGYVPRAKVSYIDEPDHDDLAPFDDDFSVE